jgi:hypothetical protein
MDTRFWGPSGWKLLHLVAAEPAGDRAPAILEWFSLLEYILPCKYCRASFHDYWKLQPLTLEIIKDTTAFSRWMYDIHNRVNGKLRGQGLVTARDPSWPSVQSRYAKIHATLCKGTPLLGWDFMTSVAFSTPAADYTPVPMPDAPESAIDWSTLDEATQNRYNLLNRQARIKYLKRWWALIPSILPCSEWRAAWAAAMRSAPPLERGREAVMRWMWKIEEGVCAGLRCPTPHASRAAMEREVSAYESGCSKTKRGKTCRTLRKAQRRRNQVRRTRKGIHVL